MGCNNFHTPPPPKKSRLLNILKDSRNLASGECSRQVDTYVDTFVMWQLVREGVTKLRRLAFDNKILLETSHTLSPIKPHETLLQG